MTQKISRLLSAILVIVLSGVITAAFGYQFIVKQNPCPLCFLQRVAMIGIAIGQVMNFRFGFKMSHHAISIFHCIFGGAVSLRQISLHICPGFSTFGTPVLGYGLYTWAFIVFVCSLIVIASMMFLYEPKPHVSRSKVLDFFERFATVFIFVIATIDIFSAAKICGLICPDNP